MQVQKIHGKVGRSLGLKVNPFEAPHNGGPENQPPDWLCLIAYKILKDYKIPTAKGQVG